MSSSTPIRSPTVQSNSKMKKEESFLGKLGGTTAARRTHPLAQPVVVPSASAFKLLGYLLVVCLLFPLLNYVV